MADTFDKDDIISEDDLPADFDWREAVTTKTLVEPVEAAVLGAADTLSLGFSDELAAGLGSLLDTDPQAYEKLLETARSKQKELAEKQPIPTFIGQLAGGIPAGTAAGSIVGTGTKLLPQIAKSAAIGGTLAGGQAFGSATGGFEQRLEAAKTPATYGTLIGAASPALSALLSKGATKASEAMLPEPALVDPKTTGTVQPTIEPPGFFSTVGEHFKRGYKSGESTIGKGRQAVKTVTDVAEETATGLKKTINDIQKELQAKLESSQAAVDVREAFSEAAAKLDDLSAKAIIDDQRIIDQYKARLVGEFEKLKNLTPVTDVAKMSSDLKRYGTASSEASRVQTGAPNVFDELTKKVDETIASSFGPEYSQAKLKQNALLSALEKLKINPRKIKFNQKLDQIIKEDQVLDPLENLLKKTAGDPAASQQIDEAVELMRVADPVLAQKMRDRLAFAAKEFKTLSEGVDLPIPKTATARTMPVVIETGLAQAANVGGRMLGKTAKIIGDAAVGGPVLRKMLDSSNIPESYKRVLMQMLESPSIKRQAVMFNLLQQPEFRKALETEAQNNADLQKLLEEDFIQEDTQ